ncbi:zinc finger protein 84-like [Macrobrachium nipponense]|uniref:zinc finger protein 84-like n=1 Tax=Macrobrachium nipponense TaxID=159736 RepID=UPI0030C87AB9
MEQAQNTTSMVWYNYTPVDGLITTTNAPVQVELGTVDIARQINQQVSLQYGNLQAVPTQPQQIIVSHHPQQPPAVATPEPAVTPKPPKARKAPTNGERVPCPECGKTFSCNANLRDHVRLHTGERPFICSECGMTFAQRSNWRLHKRVHTGERPYMCGICGKTFSRSSHLPGHMRIHTGERPYSCELCEHSFASHQALKNHSRTHTGEKPFVCEYCQTAFTHSSSLSSHKKRCTGEKRKRGRPKGSGRKMCKKKPSGRPRGRPRKKGRYLNRRKRKPVRTSEDDDSCKKDLPIKSELISVDEESENQIDIVQAKEEIEDIPTVEVDPDTIQIDGADPLDTHSETENMIAHAQESISVTEGHTIHHIVPVEEVVTVAAAAAGLDDTSSLHQEAAVAMAALHEGAALNLAHHQLPTETYVERDTSHTMWYPKQHY